MICVPQKALAQSGFLHQYQHLCIQMTTSGESPVASLGKGGTRSVFSCLTEACHLALMSQCDIRVEMNSVLHLEELPWVLEGATKPHSKLDMVFLSLT